MVFLKNKTTKINNVPTQTMVVDIRYNGIIVNYCETEDITTGCTFEEFQSKIRKLTFSYNDFESTCFKSHPLWNKIAFGIVLLIVLIFMVSWCIKEAKKEKEKEIIRSNLMKRGLTMIDDGQIVEDTPSVTLNAKLNDQPDAEIEAEVGGEAPIEEEKAGDAEPEVEIEVEADVDANVEVEAE